MRTTWAHIASLSLFALGILHMLYGAARFHRVLGAMLRDGSANGLSGSDEGRLAFWFIAFGLPLALCGHLAWRAARAGDLSTLGLIGLYACVAAIAGVIVFPRSPLWGLLAVSIMLLAVGHGWLA